MPQYNATAIVLRRSYFGETDNILTLYSKDRGRISAIAKGARKAISKLSGATDPLTCSKFALATGKGLHIVAQAEMIDSFPGLHVDVTRLAQGQYFAELLTIFTAEDDPHPEIYQLILRALRLMEKAEDTETISRWFEIRLLSELGYMPELTVCAVCRRDLPGNFGAADPFGLSAAEGGALCPLHAYSDHSEHTPLSLEALWFLRTIADLPEKASAVLAMRAPDQKAEDEARAALRRHMRFRADHDLKSVAFLDSLRFSPPSSTAPAPKRGRYTRPASPPEGIREL